MQRRIESHGMAQMRANPVREITPEEAQKLIDAGAALLDTREQH